MTPTHGGKSALGPEDVFKVAAESREATGVSFPEAAGQVGTCRARYRAPRSSVTQELLRGVAGGLRAALAALVEQLFAEGDEAAALQWRESSSWDGPPLQSGRSSSGSATRVAQLSIQCVESGSSSLCRWGLLSDGSNASV